tara:strand:- start:426 stop:596 length:171 start_codon:yes stop_codon:yes gene_type:complete
MGDFLLWSLVIVLMFAKLILFAMLIVAVWVWIKKHSPETTKVVLDKYNKVTKKESK